VSLDVEPLDRPAPVEDLPENAVPGIAEQVCRLDEPQPEARVGAVGAHRLHRLPVGHAGEGPGQVDPAGGEHAHGQLLHETVDELLVDEGGLEIELGELWLTVGAQVLVPEAAGHLEVALEAADHQELLEELGGLGQGVEGALVDAAGHQVVSRPLGRALREHRCLDLDKSLLVQVIADAFENAVSFEEIVLHGRAAKVEITVLEAKVLGHGLRFPFPAYRGLLGDHERKWVRGVQDLHGLGEDLDSPRFEAGVLRAGKTFFHAAADRQAVLAFQRFGRPAQIRRASPGAEDDLDDAAAVPQVGEEDLAVIPQRVDPPGQHDVPARIPGTQRPAPEAFCEIHCFPRVPSVQRRAASAAMQGQIPLHRKDPPVAGPFFTGTDGCASPPKSQGKSATAPGSPPPRFVFIGVPRSGWHSRRSWCGKRYSSGSSR